MAAVILLRKHPTLGQKQKGMQAKDTVYPSVPVKTMPVLNFR